MREFDVIVIAAAPSREVVGEYPSWGISAVWLRIFETYGL